MKVGQIVEFNGCICRILSVRPCGRYYHLYLLGLIGEINYSDIFWLDGKGEVISTYRLSMPTWDSLEEYKAGKL